MFLNCHSYYSFKYGTLSVEDLIAEAKKIGLRQLTLTDINNTSGIFPFVKSCLQNNIKPIVGIEFRREDQFDFIGLAQNNQGFYELNKHLTDRLRETSTPLPDFQHCYLVYDFQNYPQRPLREYEFIGIRPHQVNMLFKSCLKEQLHKLVILQPVIIRDKSEFQFHRVLRSIDKNLVISRLPSHLHGLRNEHFVPLKTLLDCYQQYPQIIINTEKILEECTFLYDFTNQKNRQNKKTFLGSRYEDKLHLEELALQGMKNRYGENNPEALRRIQKELKIIDDLDFNAYFLITHDIVSFARSQGFFYVGRGSGANSITAYCLEITDVDPIELDLYFERFLNIYRSSPPDFDMDFSWKDRDEIHKYIFKKYGEDHTVLLANFNTFKGRSIVRELGKVFGLPKAEIDELVSSRGPQKKEEVTQLIFHYGQKMQDFPNHLSIHAGGVLISEKPIYHYTATELPPKNFPLTQFDMYIAEDIKFDKLDVLSQRGLGHIRTAMELIEENKGVKVDVSRVHKFKKDPILNQALAKGDTIGCFYIESPAMRQLMLKLRCKSYPVLVAASSIIRPGVASSGMMREYIENHLAPEKVVYRHPKMKELLEDTYGIMVYQEDMIKVAHHFGGIGMAEADVLRKGMSGKGRSKAQIMEIRDAFFRNCIEKSYPEKTVAEVWRQIESFAGYSFSKAHSASFAVESYQSLFLRCYYPLEFMVAVINNFGGFYRTEFYVQEARKLGGTVLAPCVNHSLYLTTLYDKQVYLGFVHIRDLEQQLALRVVEEHIKHGNYLSLSDFLHRVPIGIEQLTILIRIGAFRFTGRNKKELLWEADLLMMKKKKIKVGENYLFEDMTPNLQLPALDSEMYEDSFDEMELLGFPLCFIYDLLDYPIEGTITTSQMEKMHGRRVKMIGYLITTKEVRTVKKERMNFGTFMDYEGNLFDSTHFPGSARNFPFLGKGFYLLQGKIVDDFGVPSIEVNYMEKIPMVPDPRYKK